jgi:hypothetical protein
MFLFALGYCVRTSSFQQDCTMSRLMQNVFRGLLIFTVTEFVCFYIPRISQNHVPIVNICQSDNTIFSNHLPMILQGLETEHRV